MALDNLERNTHAMDHVMSKIDGTDAVSVISVLNNDVYGYSSLSMASKMVKTLREKILITIDKRNIWTRKTLIEMGYYGEEARNTLNKTSWSGLKKVCKEKSRRA